MFGVAEPKDVGRCTYEVGKLIRRALGDEAHDLYWSDDGLDTVHVEPLGRRYKRLLDLIYTEDSWTIRKEWKP